jgi:heme exporter protein D
MSAPSPFFLRWLSRGLYGHALYSLVVSHEEVYADLLKSVRLRGWRFMGFLAGAVFGVLGMGVIFKFYPGFDPHGSSLVLAISMALTALSLLCLATLGGDMATQRKAILHDVRQRYPAEAMALEEQARLQKNLNHNPQPVRVRRI